MVDSWIWQEYIVQECVSAHLKDFGINRRLALNCRLELEIFGLSFGLEVCNLLSFVS
jgi:hypothetical protein